jgi:hypothetical protein
MFLPNNQRMRVMCSLGIFLGLAACSSKEQRPKITTEKGPAIVDPDEGKGPQPIETVREKMQQVDPNKPDYDDPNFKPAVVDTAAKDGKKGDREDNEWIPKEHKAGASRWKDTGVYVDGKPIGFLQWGELPIGMPVTWFEDKVSARKRPGTDDPGWRMARQRMYRFTDYFKTMGIDIKQIKELHVYGPKMTSTLIVTGKDLQLPEAKDFYFRFGSNVGGKAIPKTPGKYGNGNTPDKIASVMIYMKKAPPKLVPDVGMVLPGEKDPNQGVPYFGEPIRGGIRIYLDNKLAGIIKRQDLDAKMATTDAEGAHHYKLAEVMKKLGIDASKAKELWVIREERRQEMLPASELETLTFVASAQNKGGVLLGDKKIRANVIALHTRAIDKSEIPTVTPDDE